MSKESLRAADDAVLADLEALQKEDTPTNTPPSAEEKAQTPEKKESEETPRPKEEETSKGADPYEKRYKDLQRAFTQDRQALASTKEELSRYQQFYKEYQEWIQSQQTKDDPESIPTAAKVEEMVQARLAKERQAIREEFKNELTASELKRYERQFADELSKYTQEIVESDPLLKSQIESPEDTSIYETLIKYGQTKLFGPNADPSEPKTIDNFKSHIKSFAERKSKALRKLIENHEQAAIAKQIKAQQPAMTSPGGVIPNAQQPVKAPKWKSKDFDDWLVDAVREEQAAAKSR